MKKRTKSSMFVIGSIILFLILVGIMYYFDFLGITTTIQSAFPGTIPSPSTMGGGG